MKKTFRSGVGLSQSGRRNSDESFWDMVWRDIEGDVVIFQFPNVWLFLWLVFELASLLVSSHSTYIVCWWIATAALVVWALLEIFRGANYFRKGLGIVVGIFILLSIFGVGL